ncbi:MAG: ArsA family ATPase, partial [Aquificaceae bacterium]
RLVANPEKMVLKESQRAFMYFNLFGVNVDAVVVNKVLPPFVEDCEHFSKWVLTQKKHLEDMHALFHPVPVFTVPLMEDEIVGEKRLKILSDLIYGDTDPIRVFHKEKPYEFIEQNGDYMIKLKAPFLTKDGLSVLKSEGEIVIRWRNFKSHILLPRKLRDCEPVGAKIEEGYLKVFLSKAT